ncbi:NADH ubiquinone oxidoreductase chain A [Actinacidiphila bryophytorum]|uniref:NADH-quinone oxidoreductase subunit A n=1 Tax=Actinacidiphila bryophytorum TaxID=1436133 RepID=A0A9W4DY34_9ACTN|nr:NADH ubiquinone oxidoreductase chain A [Actinacidiphila bryophytorum]
MQATWACELPHMDAILVAEGDADHTTSHGPNMSVTADWKERGTVNAYAPIFVLGGIAAGFAIFSVFMASIIGPKRYNRAKLEAYECGIEPTPQPAGGGRFPIKYYLTAMLFIVFDIEIVFLYPWAVTFDRLGMFGLVEMLLFVLTVFVAYAYVWRRGGLEWD